VPYLPDGYDEPTTTPHDTTDAQRGWSIAPTRYTEVVSLGTPDVVNADGFLGFMNLTAVGTALRDPAPVAIKFSVRGETVLRETFVATLNGIDVTAAFTPAGPDGADLVALFSVGSSPLVSGENLLITTVTGHLPGTSPAVTVVDTDRMTFVVTQ
jgi:hypothetical protein